MTGRPRGLTRVPAISPRPGATAVDQSLDAGSAPGSVTGATWAGQWVSGLCHGLESHKRNPAGIALPTKDPTLSPAMIFVVQDQERATPRKDVLSLAVGAAYHPR